MSDGPQVPAGAEPAPPEPRSPRGRPARRLLELLFLLAGLSLLVHWATRPQRVASLVMSQTGRALGLEITASGASEYHLRGWPQIVLRDVVARQPGNPTPVLRAERVLLSLPWSTLRSRGRDLVIHRIELDAPVLHVAAMRQWLASRPDTGETRTPRLTNGFIVRRGQVLGGDWRIGSVDIDVPSLAPGEPVRGRVRGRAVAAATTIAFDVHASLTAPGAGGGLGIVGPVRVMRNGWQLALDLHLRGLPDFEEAFLLRNAAAAADAVYTRGDTRLAFRIGLAGEAHFAGGLVLQPAGLVLRQGREIPDLRAGGRIAWTRALALDLAGTMHEWPRRWPSLPSPLHRGSGPMPFSLDYEGPVDFPGVADLRLSRGPTRFDAHFRLPHVVDWLDDPPTGTPIPPLDGTLFAPRLDIPGATLEGVEIEVDGLD